MPTIGSAPMKSALRTNVSRNWPKVASTMRTRPSNSASRSAERLGHRVSIDAKNAKLRRALQERVRVTGAAQRGVDHNASRLTGEEFDDLTFEHRYVKYVLAICSLSIVKTVSRRRRILYSS